MTNLNLFRVLEAVGFEVGGETSSGAVLHDDEVLGLVDEIAVVELGDVGVVQQFKVIYFSDDLFDLSLGIAVEEFDCYFVAIVIDGFADFSEGAPTQNFSVFHVVETAELFAIDFSVILFMPFQFLIVHEHGCSKY